MEHKHHPEAQVKEETTDHSKMNHITMQHRHDLPWVYCDVLNKMVVKNSIILFIDPGARYEGELFQSDNVNFVALY